MRMSLLMLALAGAFALTACQREADATDPVDSAPAAAGDTATPPAESPPEPSQPVLPAVVDVRATLSGQVWRVERSDAAEVGSTYAFLEDGALVVDSPNGTPMTGSWAVSDDGKLSMTEEGITYPTDLVVHDAEHITLRSHNPAGVVEIALLRAPAVPLPTATAPAG